MEACKRVHLSMSHVVAEMCCCCCFDKLRSARLEGLKIMWCVGKVMRVRCGGGEHRDTMASWQEKDINNMAKFLPVTIVSVRQFGHLAVQGIKPITQHSKCLGILPSLIERIVRSIRNEIGCSIYWMSAFTKMHSENWFLKWMLVAENLITKVHSPLFFFSEAKSSILLSRYICNIGMQNSSWRNREYFLSDWVQNVVSVRMWTQSLGAWEDNDFFV